jgi:hypothetical protein
MDNTKKVIIEASFKDRASAGIKGLGGSTNNLQQNLHNLGQGMANVGKRMSMLSGVAIALGVVMGRQVINAAMDAEGAWNKFATVFGDHAEEMAEWVTEIRQELPSSTTAIQRMASGIQDLLIPMGFARDQAMGMTQETIELANALAAFNDVPVEQVLDAMISGFSGMTRPLKQFGIDVPVERLEAMAVQQGIVTKNLSELDFETRRTVQAQLMLEAAYEDSTDALEGFDANQDSALRRTQDLTASFEDQKQKLGFALLPIYDEALKAIIPIINSIGDWIQENEALIQQVAREFLSALKDLVFWLKDEVAPVIMEVMRNIRAWMKQNPELASQLVKVAGVLTILFVALGPVLMIMGSLFMMIAGVIGAGTITILVAKIVLIASAFAGIVVAGMNLYKTFKLLFETVFSIAINKSNELRQRVENLKSSFMGLVQPLSSVWNLLSRITSLDLGIVAGAVKSITGRQSGGNVMQSGMYKVGEFGPEKVYLPQGSRVVNASDTARESSGQQVVINNTFAQTDMDVDTLAQKLSFQLKYL